MSAPLKKGQRKSDRGKAEKKRKPAASADGGADRSGLGDRDLLLALVTDAVSEGIYDWNIETNSLEVSDRLHAILGMEEGGLKAGDWNALVHPEDSEIYSAALKRHFQGQTQRYSCEYRIRRKSGDYIWVADQGRCLRDEDGRAVRLVGAISDITQRKAAETSLRRSEERYALAMKAVNEGVYDWNLETGDTYYSDGVRSAMGFTPQELANAEDWFVRIHPDDQPVFNAALVDHFKGHADRFECEFRYRGTDDRWRWARQHGIAEFDADGRAVRVIGATGDITDLKRRQEEAAEAREMLAKAVDSISEGFVIYDAEDRLVLCNDQYRRLYPNVADKLEPGITHEELLHALATKDVMADFDGDVDSWVRGRQHRHLNPGEPYEQELADGRWVKVAWRKTADGGVVGVFTDITAMKEAEIAVRESEERYALAMDSANEALWDWDVDAGTIFVAPSFVERFGFAVDDGNQMSIDYWSSRIHPEDIGVFRTAIRDHLKGETEFYTCEFRALSANDDYIWIHHRGLGQRDERGRVYRMTGSTGDISARKEAERKLTEARREAENARQHLKDAIEALSEGIVLFDQDDRILLYNSIYKQYYADIVGEEVAGLIEVGTSLWDILRGGQRGGMFPDLPQDAEGFEEYLDDRKRRRKSGEARQAVEMHLSDGRWLQINEHKTADGGIASVYTEITELKKGAAALAEKTATLEGLSKKLAKYLSPQVYDSIFTGEQTVEVASKRKKLTVFFSDIADFTSTADLLESEELTALLNQYLTEMSRIALEHGATIDKFIGDAILAFFGDPESKGAKEDALACVRMAVAMQQRMVELQDEWRGRGIEQAFEMRIGVTTGYCTVGNFGSEDRIDYTVIGNPVNLAARLQGRADLGGILLAAETESLVKDAVRTEAHGVLELKGIPRPVPTYKVVGIHGDAPEDGAPIHRDQPGLRLEVDPSKLKGKAKAEVAKALRDAADKLEG